MDKSELQGKSVRELRAMLTERRIAHADCVEKDELVARLLAAPPAASPAPRSFRTRPCPNISDRHKIISFSI